MSGLDIEGVLAGHDAYRVNEDGWTVCICGHVAVGDDDDGSHARHVAAVLREQIAAWLESAAEAGDLQTWRVASALAAQAAPSRVAGEET
jgi:hypothetical protein